MARSLVCVVKSTTQSIHPPTHPLTRTPKGAVRMRLVVTLLAALPDVAASPSSGLVIPPGKLPGLASQAADFLIDRWIGSEVNRNVSYNGCVGGGIGTCHITGVWVGETNTPIEEGTPFQRKN